MLIFFSKSWVCLGIQGHTPGAAPAYARQEEQAHRGANSCGRGSSPRSYAAGGGGEVPVRLRFGKVSRIGEVTVDRRSDGGGDRRRPCPHASLGHSVFQCVGVCSEGIFVQVIRVADEI
jgi:hypothetical protein